MRKTREHFQRAVALLAFVCGVGVMPQAAIAAGGGDEPFDPSRPDIDAKAGLGVAGLGDAGETEPGPMICGQLDPACAQENAERTKALSECSLEASRCRSHCIDTCGPPPTCDPQNPECMEVLDTFNLCKQNVTSCENQCDGKCTGLPQPTTCDTIPIPATCSQCTELEYVKVCEVHGWLPFQPAVLHIVSTCDVDWSGIGTCSPCHKQLTVGPRAGQRTCQCRYPAPQTPGSAWKNICYLESPLDKPVSEDARGR